MDVPRAAVSAMVVKDERLLMVRRGPTGRYAGMWSLPGGRIDYGERADDAVRREVAEETGLEVRVDRPVAVRDVLPEDGGDHYVVIVYRADVAGGTLVAGDDADDVAWVPLDDVGARPTTPGLLDVLRAAGLL